MEENLISTESARKGKEKGQQKERKKKLSTKVCRPEKYTVKQKMTKGKQNQQIEQELPKSSPKKKTEMGNQRQEILKMRRYSRKKEHNK